MTIEDLKKATELLDEIDMLKDQQSFLDDYLKDDDITNWKVQLVRGQEFIDLFKSVCGYDFIGMYRKNLKSRIEQLENEFKNL